MLDQESLRPVIIAMALYIAVNIILPRIVTKPTGFQPLDDIVMTSIAQRDSLMYYPNWSYHLRYQLHSR
jgi:hypothetical protein